MSRYIPENNYLDTNYSPIKEFTTPMCDRCEAYYKGLFESGITKSPFPPNCEKEITRKALSLKEEDFDDIAQYEEAIVLMDPVSWAQAEFGWTARFYQTDMLSCTSRYKIYRMGRRVGKTEALVIETLHHVATNKNHTVLIIAPYERQVTRFFDEMSKFINMSTTIKGSLSRYTKTPSRMEFNNGSKVLGFSSGATSSSGSDKIRGQDAHLIVIDEIDTLENSDIDAVMAILASHPECGLVAASTPRGWRKKFYSYCTEKDSKFKEFWFISAESPSWTKETEDFFKSTTDPTTYTHEYLADFAELEDGVFKTNKLNASIYDYSMDDIEPSLSNEYVLGIDWNKSAGTHMVIIENNGSKLKLVKKIVVPESMYTQTEAVELIKTLNRKWRFKYIFADAGYGSVQCELLRKHTLIEPSSLFDQKLFPIAMNQDLHVIDPITGEPINRQAKHFLIEQTKRLLDDGLLILPKSEDTSVSTNNMIMGVIQQMRNFRMESVSIYGIPRYSQGEDHTLTAYYLAVGGYYWKEGDLRGAPYIKEVRGVEISDEVSSEAHPSLIERHNDLKKGLKLIRTSNKQGVPRPQHSREIDLGSSVRRSGLNNLKRSISSRENSIMSKKPSNGYKRGKF